MKTGLQGTELWKAGLLKFANAIMIVGFVLFSTAVLSNSTFTQNRETVQFNQMDRRSDRPGWSGSFAKHAEERHPSALYRYQGASNLKTKVARNTPEGIEMIEREVYDSENNAWYPDERDVYAALPGEDGYSIIYYNLENGEWTSYYKDEFILASNGKLIRYDSYDYDYSSETWEYVYRILIEYDDNDRPTLMKEEWWEEGAWVASWQITYTHNSDGSISYLDEILDSDDTYEGTISEVGNNVVDEWVKYEQNVTYYYRQTLFNVTLEEFLSFGDYRFVWIEYEYEEKQSADDEYEPDEQFRIVEENNNEIIYQSAYYSYDDESGSYVLTPSYRETVMLENDRIIRVTEAEYFDGEWDTWARNNYIYNTQVAVEPVDGIIDDFSLIQNYPNPFNPTTQIQFTLPQATHVQLIIYDMLGRRVSTLVDDVRSAGLHTVTFDASSLASSTYIYRLKTDTYSRSRKMLLAK